MIMLKEGVRIVGLQAEMALGLIIIDSVFERYGKDVVITEATGGDHMVNSLHPKGLALDIRSKAIEIDMKRTILDMCRQALGENFDIILEHPGQDSEHFHVEVDPK